MPDPTPAPTPTPDPTPAPSPTPAKPWYEGKADTETIGHWDNKGWKKDDPAEIAIQATKAARELQKHFGVPADQLIKLPKDVNDEAGWSAVHQRLGVPKEAKEYDFSTVTFKDGTALDDSFTDVMRKALHGSAVPKDKASGIVKTVVDYIDGSAAADADEKAAALQVDRQALQKEWGANWEFNRLTAMQGAKRAVGNEDAAAKVIAAMEGAIGYKNTMEFWRKIGAGTTEDTFHDGGRGGTNPATRAGAVARKAELMSDGDFRKRYLGGDLKARQEMDNLNLLIVGDAA